MSDLHIPAGQAAALFPDRLEGVRSASGFTGMTVDGRGRISMTINGEGVRATFTDPDALRALGAVLFQVAEQMEVKAAAAATEAAADLNRIAAAFTPETRKYDA